MWASPASSWEAEFTNDSTVITHTGGDDISADAAFVQLDGSSAAWTLLTSDTDGTVSAGDRARIVGVGAQRGEDIQILWQPGDGDCESIIGEA